MNLAPPSEIHSGKAPSERGSALLIVLVVLTLVISLGIGNSIALAHLKREIRRIEERQLDRYGAALISTNRSPAKITVKPVGPQTNKPR
jgi:hypothetical protein